MPGKPKLYAHQVKILKYVKVGDAWRFANVVKSSGRMVRRPRPDCGPRRTPLRGQLLSGVVRARQASPQDSC
jgi:hypothetical protein